MKSFTDIEQSERLDKILSPESADMRWRYNHNTHKHDDIPQMLTVRNWDDPYNKDIPCWSLTALIDAMKFDFNLEKFEFDQSDYFTYSVVFELEQTKIRTREHENAIDACYEMILKLQDQMK